MAGRFGMTQGSASEVCRGVGEENCSEMLWICEEIDKKVAGIQK